MKKLVLSTLMATTVAASALMPVAAQAEGSKKLNPWQDCGIGAMIFPNNGAAAAISNIIWDLGTTAVSTNVSSQESCASEKAQTALDKITTKTNKKASLEKLRGSLGADPICP